MSKIGFHIAANCGGCNGIIDMLDELNSHGAAFSVYSANDAGILEAASRFNHATLIYRDVDASTVNPADYLKEPSPFLAGVYWRRYLSALPLWVRENKNRVWLELLNEPGREPHQAAWVGSLMYHMALLALGEGYRVMGPGWATGNPEPEAWRSGGWPEYLRLCATHREQVAVSLHEYSLDNDIHHMEPWHVGRFTQVLDACDQDQMDIAAPDIYITECGWTLNSMPDDEQAKLDIAYLDSLYGPYTEIRCAMLWTLQEGKGNGNLPQRLNAMFPWMTEYAIATKDSHPLPPTTPQPPENPPVSNVNMLKNPSFNDEDWTNATEFSGQHPKYWLVAYNDLPNEVVPSQPDYGPIEGVHKGKGELPQDEWDLFLLDEGYCYKLFAPGPRPIWGRLKQEIADLRAGRYKLTTRAYNDCHRKIPGGGKDYNLEPNHAQTMIKLNGKVVRDWTNLKAGEWHHTETAIDHAGGIFDLAVHFRANWGTENAFFLDDWSLVKIEEPVPPEPPMPDETLEEVLWERATSAAPTNLDAALQKHILSTADYVPYGPEKWVAYEGLQYATQAAMDWGNMRQRVYWCRVPEWDKIYFIDDPEATLEPAIPVADRFTSPVGTSSERDSGVLWN